VSFPWKGSWSKQRVVTLLLLFAAALPLISISALIARYAVEVPMLDDWEIAPVLAKQRTGQLSFADLFKQEEEARIVFPKLIFLATTGAYWDVRHQICLSPIWCALTAIALYRLLRHAQVAPVVSAFCLCLMSLLIFSPAQFELWIFASGFPSFMPALLIIAALLLCETRAPEWVKFAGCGLLAILNSFTLPHGLLAWALTYPVHLIAARPVRWQRWAFAWSVILALCAGVYFHDYSKPAHLPEFAPAVSWWSYVRYFFAFLGSSFAFGVKNRTVAVADICGGVMLMFFAAAGVYAWTRRGAGFRRRALPWFAIGLYSIGSAILATLGRVGFERLEWAHSSRYITFALYLPVSVIALLAIARPELRKIFSAKTQLALFLCVGAFGLVALVLYVSAYQYSVAMLRYMSGRNHLARTAVLFSPVLDTSALIKKLNYPEPTRAMRYAAMLDDLHLTRPPLIRTTEVESFPREDEPQSGAGWLNEITQVDDEHLRASGWAALKAKRTSADGVVLAYEREDGRRVIFAISDEIFEREKTMQSSHAGKELWSGWLATFPRAIVPPNARISAWAFDAETTKLYRLKQRVVEISR
jgi:hypothetical protein